MDITWHNDFMNLVHITIHYFNGLAWVLEQFKQIVNEFMDGFYNVIYADDANQAAANGTPPSLVTRDP